MARKHTEQEIKCIATAYKKFLLGEPISQVGLNDEQVQDLRLFIALSGNGQTAFQISLASYGAVDSDLAAVLKRTRRTTTREINRIKKWARPTSVEKSQKKEKPVLKIEEVMKLMAEGTQNWKIRRAGGSSWQLGKCGVVRSRLNAGESAQEIANVSGLKVDNVKKLIRVYEKNKMKVEVRK